MPNQEGQEATEKDDDGTMLYRFAKVEKEIMHMKMHANYMLYHGNEDKEVIMRGTD